MANENPSPLDDPTPAVPVPLIQVLLAGNIADDDMMWVVRCSASEFPKLVQSPLAWVAALAGLPDWVDHGTGGPAKAPTLMPDFALTVQVSDVPDPLGRIVVQGIDGTNSLTVVASGPASAVATQLGLPVPAPGAGPFQPFWDEVSADPANPPSLKKKLPLNVAVPIARLFGHFEILDRSHTTEERALRTAAYLLGVALDPAGHAAMLSGLDQELLELGAVAAMTQDAAQAPEAVAFAAAPGAGVVYASVQGDGTDDEMNTCSLITGPTDAPDAPTVPIDGTVVKFYGGGSGA